MLRDGKTWVNREQNIYLPFVIDSKKINNFIRDLKKLFEEPPCFVNYGVLYSDGVSENTQRLDDILTYENPSSKKINKLTIQMRENDKRKEYGLAYTTNEHGIEITLQEKRRYSCEGFMIIEVAGPEDWVDTSLMRIRKLLEEITLVNPHKAVAPLAPSLYGTAKSMAWAFLPIIFLVLGSLFIKEAFFGGVHTTLDSWPNELTIPVHLTERIQYDRDAKSIWCNGVMTEKEKRKLLSLSNEVSYQQSIMKLYDESNFVSAAIFWLTVSACLIGALLLTLWLLAYLFPMGAFVIGEGETRYNELLALRRNIFWSVIVSAMLAVTIPFVYKLILKG